jgi:hypothetical protein
MFRNAWEGSRDLYLSRSADGGKSFDEGRKLGVGTWKLEACPMDGGVYAAWTHGMAVLVRKPGKAQPEIVSEDGGFPSSVALPDGSVMMAWESNGSIVIRRVR